VIGERAHPVGVDPIHDSRVADVSHPFLPGSLSA